VGLSALQALLHCSLCAGEALSGANLEVSDMQATLGSPSCPGSGSIKCWPKVSARAYEKGLRKGYGEQYE